MAHFLRGNFKGFFKCGPSECVKDVYRFSKSGENAIKLEVTRKDMEAWVGKYWRYESLSMKLEPEDASNPRLGGRVIASGLVFDLRTFTPQMKKFVGVYNDEFLTIAELKDKSQGASEE